MILQLLLLKSGFTVERRKRIAFEMSQQGELLHNSAITKMALVTLMLGHSEDYVSILSSGLVHTAPDEIRCHFSSTIKSNTMSFLLENTLVTHLLRNSSSLKRKTRVQTWDRALPHVVFVLPCFSSVPLKASSRPWSTSFPEPFEVDGRSSSRWFVWCPT